MPSKQTRVAVVLSVGNDGSLLNSRNEVLRHAGYRVLAARNRHEAVVVASSEEIDVALICFAFPRSEAELIAHDLELVRPSARILMLVDFESLTLREEATSPEFLLHVVRASLEPRSAVVPQRGAP